MADSVAQNIQNLDERDKSRIDLVSTMGRAPMLPVEGLILTKDKEFQTSVKPQIKARTVGA
jgi:hypothetical protein